MKANWQISSAAPDDALKLYESCGVNKYAGSILFSRGIRSRDDIIRFIYPELNSLYSPFLMSGMAEAVTRIRKAIELKEKIAIFADSDLDGITSLAILHDLLSKCGSEPYIRYPRDNEGYGLTCEIIDEFISAGIDLLITVDSGIRDIEEIAYAVSNSMEVIITDHHEPDSIHPDAIIVNPKMPGCIYPFKELAGVGVAFKLAQGILFSYTNSYNRRFVLISYSDNKYRAIIFNNGIATSKIESEQSLLSQSIQSHFLSDDHVILTDGVPDEFSAMLKRIYSDISVNTLLTISNLATGKIFQNNEMMKNDLLKAYRIHKEFYSDDEINLKLFTEIQMRSSRKSIERLTYYIGLVAIGTIADIMPLYGENRNLIKYGLDSIRQGKGHRGIQSLLNASDVSSKSISWDVAPLLNTPGRLGETGLTVDFFLTQDYEAIKNILKQIEKLNSERKLLVTSMTEKIIDNINSDSETNRDKIYFYMDHEIKSGLAGLIASRIADELKKPVIIAVPDGDSESVKGSGRSFNNFNFFRYVEPLAHMFERIGGHAQAFGFTAKRESMPDIIRAVNMAIADEYTVEDFVKIDCMIDVDHINTSLVEKISLLEPFGKNNEEPVFISEQVCIESFSRFGSGGNHGKYVLKNGLNAIGWNLSDKMELYIKTGAPVDIIFNLENNTFMNRTFPRLKILDIDFS